MAAPRVDPLEEGIALVWYENTAVRVPIVCSCCMSYMSRCADVYLVAGDADNPTYTTLPMPYCAFCYERNQAWGVAEAKGIWEAVAKVMLPLTLLGIVIDVALGLGVYETLVLLGAEIMLAFGATIFAARHFKAGPHHVPGHAPHCRAVESHSSGAFNDRGRSGGVLHFKNWRFAMHWSEVNGITRP